MPEQLQIVTTRQATAQHPRHSEPAMIELKDGSILIVWQEFEQSAEDNAPARLSTMISRDDGRSWSEHRVAVENSPGDINVYSPSLVRSKDGDILLIYMRKHSCEAGKPLEWSGYIKRSTNEGRTFGPESLVWSRRPLGMASSVVKRLDTGRLLLPILRQTGLVWSPTDHWVAGCLFSDDDGASWQTSQTWLDLPMRGAMEPHVAQLSDGRVMMVMRTQLGAIFQSLSSDGGTTWSKPQTSSIPAPESCPELVNIPDSTDLMLAWNNSEYDMHFASHYGKRNPLSVAISKDNGATWGKPREIVNNPNHGHTNPVAFCTRSGKWVLAWFEAEYSKRWLMEENFSLRAAIFNRQWLYADPVPE
jgi:sialidase-1